MKRPVFATGSATGGSWSPSFARFMPITGGTANTTIGTTYGAAAMPVAVAGKFSRLNAYLPAALTAGSYDIELLVNGVASALKVTISSAGVKAADLVNEVAVVAGDTVALRITPTGSPTAQTSHAFSMMFEATVSGKTQLFGYVLTSVNATAIAGSVAQGDGLEDSYSNISTGGGTLDGFSIHIQTAPGTGNSRTFQMRAGPPGALVNVGAPITFADAEGNVVKSVTGLNVTLAPGDNYSIAETVGGTPTTSPVKASIALTPATNGIASTLARVGSQAAAADRFMSFAGGEGAAFGSDGAVYAIAPCDMVVKAIRAETATAPGTGKSRSFTLRKNGADTALAASIADTATGATASADVPVASGDLLSFRSSPTGTPTSSSFSKVMSFMTVSAQAAVVSFVPGDQAGQVWEGVRGASAVKIAGAYSNTPTSVQVRLIDAAGAAVTGFDWTNAATQANGVYGHAFASVPIGGPYRHQVREGASGAITTSGAVQYVGAVVIDWGQSQREKMYTSDIGGTAAASGVKATVVRINNQLPANGTPVFTDVASGAGSLGGGIVAAANQWWADTGVPVMFVKINWEGTAIQPWIDNNTDTSAGATWGRWDFAQAMMIATKRQCSAVTWMQGTSDVNNIAGPPSYVEKMETLRAKFEAELSGMTPLHGVMPHPRSNDGNNTWALRAAQYGKAISGGTWRLLAWLLDWQMDANGAAHQLPGASGGRRGGTRYGRGLAKMLRDNTLDIAGPRIVSAVRASSGAYVDVTFDRDIKTPAGATTALPGWWVSADGTTWTPLANVTGAITGARVLRLTPNSGTIAAGSRLDLLRGVPFSSDPTGTATFAGNEADAETNYLSRVITDTSAFDGGRGMPAAPYMGTGYAITEAGAPQPVVITIVATVQGGNTINRSITVNPA